MPDTLAQVSLPGPALVGCVRAHIQRNTVGVELTAAQRLTHFPATASCSLVWVLEGDMQRPATGERQPWPVALRGPHGRPITSSSAGPVRLFFVLLMPDALRALTGIDVGALLNRVGDAHAALGPAWRDMMRRVAAAGDDAERWRQVEDFLAPRWAAVKPQRSVSALRLRDWSDALAIRAQDADRGRSLRQVERRVRSWSGLPLRSLRGMARAEAGLLAALERQGGTRRMPWADVALQGGWSDQSHFCREVRRVTGFSPQALLRGIATDEAFWVYRAWSRLTAAAR